MTVRPMLAALLAASLAACGGAPPPEAPTTEPGDAPPGTDAPGAADEGPSLEELQQKFVAGCTEKLPKAPEYCQCSWEQMQASFTVEEMRGKSDPARMDAFRKKVIGACGDKMPEAELKSGFIGACTAQGQNELAPYCECSWSEYRKQLSLGDLANEDVLQSARFKKVREDAVKVCAPKLPEKVAKAGFMKGCTKTDAHKPFCDCAWKTIRKDNSPAAIQSGMVDLKAMQSKIKASCAKFRPSKG